MRKLSLAAGIIGLLGVLVAPSSAAPEQLPSPVQSTRGTASPPTTSPQMALSAASSLPAVTSCNPVIPFSSQFAVTQNSAATFSEYPVGTVLTAADYLNDGIVLCGDSSADVPFITTDGANPSSPVLSGSPIFEGDIVGSFVQPGTTKSRTTDSFSLDVGFIDNPGSTEVSVYDRHGSLLGNVVASQYGINHLVMAFKGAASFVVHDVTSDSAGWAVDNILPWPAQTGYVALGDSYSSGEGNSPFFPGPGSCDVSPVAWPTQLANLHQQISQWANLACSGATTTEVLSQQLPALQGLENTIQPSIVTVTMGGDDNAVFASILKDCYEKAITANGSCLSDGMMAWAVSMLTQLGTYIASDYQTIRSAIPPAARLIVVGYPRLFPVGAQYVYNCSWLTPAVQVGLNGLASQLDGELSAAAAQAGVEYLSILNLFNRHELCSKHPWINPIEFPAANTPAHPNAAGQLAIEKAVASYLGLSGK